MDINTLDELNDLLRTLRANGVTCFKSSACEVVLGPVVVGAEPTDSDTEEVVRDDRFGDGRIPNFDGS